MRAIVICLLVLLSDTARPDDRIVTLQVRDKEGHVCSTWTARIPKDMQDHFVSDFVKSLAKDPYDRIKASVYQLQEIYRRDSVDGTVQVVWQYTPGEPSVDILRSGDILVFSQGAYSCGH